MESNAGAHEGASPLEHASTPHSTTEKSNRNGFTSSVADPDADVLIVGGGLAGSLTALKLSVARPDLKVLLIEAGDSLGGQTTHLGTSQRTWGFFESDVSTDSLFWLKPLITRTWSEFDVEFPRLKKTLTQVYLSFRSEDLHAYLLEKSPQSVLLNSPAEKVASHHVRLVSGQTLHAPCVLDARGIDEMPPTKRNGFHKYVALELELTEPHNFSRPLMVDAICPQLDGYRRFMVLPWQEKSVWIRESSLSDSPELNRARLLRSIQSYAERKGLRVSNVAREEYGVLPAPMTSEYLSMGRGAEAPLPIGIRGGYFHATTGESIAEIVQIAEYLSSIPNLGTEIAREGLAKFRRSFLSRQSFYRLLNRILFYACEPSLRFTVFQHLYEFSDDVMERFNSGKTTWRDRWRILGASSPVPLKRKIKTFSERSVRSPH